MKATPVTADCVSARRLSEASGLHVTKRGDDMWFAEAPGCACSLLTDNADFSADCWDLKPDVIEPLARAFALLGKEARGFTFEAVWAGDKIESESRMSTAAFLKQLRENRVKNGHRYHVGRG